MRALTNGRMFVKFSLVALAGSLIHDSLTPNEILEENNDHQALWR